MLSDDGKVVVDTAINADENAFVVVNGMRGPIFEDITDPFITGNGQIVAYGASTKSGWLLVIGDRQIPMARSLSRCSLAVSSDGRRYACTLNERIGHSSARRVMVDGVMGEAFAEVGKPSFSADGRHVTYAASSGDKEFIVVDGQKFEAPGRRTDPIFTFDGKSVSYAALLGREIWWKVRVVE